MTHQPNKATSTKFQARCHAMMLRLKQSMGHIAAAHAWQWTLFERDLISGEPFVTGSARPVVSLGMPWMSQETSVRWLGVRIFFWPCGIPARRRVSIVSSRLKQRLDEESWWFDLLRTAVLRTHPTLDLLCAVTGTASHRFVRRAADLFGRSLMEFHLDSQQQIVDEKAIALWLTNAAGSSEFDLSAELCADDFVAEPPIVECYVPGKQWSVLVSPPIGFDEEATAVELAQQPIADRILFAAGDRIQVLRVRPHGAIQTLLNHHTQDPERSESLVMLASESDGELPTGLINATGCIVPWLLKTNAVQTEQILSVPENSKDDRAENQAGTATISKTSSDLQFGSQASTQVSSPLTHPADWLLHWTRSTVGPWPNQQEQEFDDELILGCRSSDRSALATLLRIVNEGRLWASSEAIRGGYRVVSFTEVPLSEFRQRRKYRRHRRRFDFELWGIAIRRDLLTANGARPVIYGDEEVWKMLPEQDKPFFQNSSAGDGWTLDEREWRITNHVQLKELPATAVMVFVESESAKQIVEMQTDWPVVVIPAAD